MKQSKPITLNICSTVAAEANDEPKRAKVHPRRNLNNFMFKGKNSNKCEDGTLNATIAFKTFSFLILGMTDELYMNYDL